MDTKKLRIIKISKQSNDVCQEVTVEMIRNILQKLDEVIEKSQSEQKRPSASGDVLPL